MKPRPNSSDQCGKETVSVLAVNHKRITTFLQPASAFVLVSSPTAPSAHNFFSSSGSHAAGCCFATDCP